MFWQGTLMRSSWQCYSPVWGDVTVRVQHGLEDQSVMFHSLYSQWSVCKPRVWAGCPWITTRGTLSSFHTGTLSLLCKAPFSSWLLPPARAGPHLISWPGRESMQTSKLGTGAPRDQMDKEQWTSKPHLRRGRRHLVLLLLPMDIWGQWCQNFSFLPPGSKKSLSS